MAIKGIKLAPSHNQAILPICGVYIARTKKVEGGYSLYIDHFTSEQKTRRSYKHIFIHVKNPDSLFMRLCAAFKVELDPSTTSQQSAASLLAQKLAERGAIKCTRVGKAQDWMDIEPWDFDGVALPWGFTKLEGMKLTSLWVTEEPSSVDIDEMLLSIQSNHQ